MDFKVGTRYLAHGKIWYITQSNAETTVLCSKNNPSWCLPWRIDTYCRSLILTQDVCVVVKDTDLVIRALYGDL